jgi:hypothetical protein
MLRRSVRVEAEMQLQHVDAARTPSDAAEAPSQDEEAEHREHRCEAETRPRRSGVLTISTLPSIANSRRTCLGSRAASTASMLRQPLAAAAQMRSAAVQLQVAQCSHHASPQRLRCSSGGGSLGLPLPSVSDAACGSGVACSALGARAVELRRAAARSASGPPAPRARRHGARGIAAAAAVAR